MLQALDFWIEPPRRVVLAGPPEDPATRELLRASHQVFQPNKVVMGNTGQVVPFVKTLPLQDRHPTAYVCTGTSCQPPTRDEGRLRGLLR